MARKILLADDSVTAQNMGRKILVDAGYEVIAVNNGSAALKKIGEVKPDLAILDVYMPGYSGLEVCQRLKEVPDTARIPVLLSVGKLEPFKPEEAQRVRAEAYIVKPFEASELLSALAKLEDKIVPRAEPSKPGRFARAIASVEESGRGNGPEATAERGGWKNRIGFPQQKTESEEKVADDASIYNAMNRDLRTVVETPAEKAAEKENKSETKSKENQEKLEAQAFVVKAEESNVDLAALAPDGLPKEVTAEEIAAIAAAAAQIQMVSAMEETEETAGRVVKDDFEKPISQAPTEKAAAEVSEEQVPAEQPEEKIEEKTETETEKDEDESEAEPVTMAAAVQFASSAVLAEARWTAVAVALSSDEQALSLEQEMHKAYGYGASAAEANSNAIAQDSNAALAVSETRPAESDSTPAPSREEVSLASAANSEAAVAESAVQVPVEAAQAWPDSSVLDSNQASEIELGTDQPVDAVAELRRAEALAASAVPDSAVPDSAAPDLAVAQAVAIADAASEHSLGQPVEATSQETSVDSSAVAGSQKEFDPAAELIVSDLEAPAAETIVAASTGSPAAQEESEPEPEVSAAQDLAVAEVSAPSNGGFASFVRDSAQMEDPKLDPDTVKSTAAAWASWRQIRDASPVAEVPHQPIEAVATEAVALSQPQQTAEAQPVPPDATAMAVAAGAENIPQEVSTAQPKGHLPDVASIVDSVLADLRPKLMEEISRKMSGKK